MGVFLITSWRSDYCSDGKYRSPLKDGEYRSSQGSISRKRKYPEFQNDDFSEEKVFKNLVVSGGLSSINQYTEENVHMEAFVRWLQGQRTKLSVYTRQHKPICIGPFLKEATLCFEHTSRYCRRLNCNHFHICSFYLNGICKRGRNCKKGHNFNDYHNGQIIDNLDLE